MLITRNPCGFLSWLIYSWSRWFSACRRQLPLQRLRLISSSKSGPVNKLAHPEPLGCWIAVWRLTSDCFAFNDLGRILCTVSQPAITLEEMHRFCGIGMGPISVYHYCEADQKGWSVLVFFLQISIHGDVNVFWSNFMVEPLSATVHLFWFKLDQCQCVDYMMSYEREGSELGMG